MKNYTNCCITYVGLRKNGSVSYSFSCIVFQLYQKFILIFYVLTLSKFYQDQIWTTGHGQVFRDETEEGFSLENYQPSFTLCRISTKVRVAALLTKCTLKIASFLPPKAPRLLEKARFISVSVDLFTGVFEINYSQVFILPQLWIVNYYVKS